MANSKQRKIVNIDPGVFVVRYATAEDEIRPPKITVAMDPNRKSDPNILQHAVRAVTNFLIALYPIHTCAVLTQPGSALVLKTTCPGQLVVHVTPSQREGSSAATVKIEPLLQNEVISIPKSATAEVVAGNNLRILGHLAGIGDVFVQPDEWLAGPTSPSRIEGIAIDWPEIPRRLNLRYCVKTSKPQANSERMMEPGLYAGTRGRALPIVGVIVEISGPDASRYEISAEAIFLGSSHLRATGKRIVFAGPTGREPLVGFRLRIEEPSTKNEFTPPTLRASASKGHVRVFHNRTQPSTSLAS